MNSPDTFGLTVTNSVLGVLVLVTLLLTAGAVVWELIARIRRRRAIDAELKRDMREFFGPARLRK